MLRLRKTPYERVPPPTIVGDLFKRQEDRGSKGLVSPDPHGDKAAPSAGEVRDTPRRFRATEPPFHYTQLHPPISGAHKVTT